VPNLISTRQDKTTETFVYDDGTEETVERLAYVEPDNTVHTDNCAVVTKLLASDNPEDRATFKEMELAEVIAYIDNGLPTDLTECRACDKLRAAADMGPTQGPPTDQKEKNVPTKTVTAEIELPASIKPTPTILAVFKALQESGDGSGTTAQIAKAAGVTPTSANTALLALESAGLMAHIDTGAGKNKVRTWGLKTAQAKPPARRSAAELQASMTAKQQEAAAKKAAAPKVPAPGKSATVPKAGAASTATRASTGERQTRALEFMKTRPEEPLSVLVIEQGCNYPVKTLAGVLARMAEKGDMGVERATTEAGRKGFKYVPPKVKKAS
jgi:hypothetical protein